MSKPLTPCFILDADRLRSNVESLRKGLAARFPSSVVAYSVKTNSSPAMLEVLLGCGCWAEVVSYSEYALALELGFERSHIVYNGPMKSKESFEDALIAGAVVNIDTKRELDWLEAMPERNTPYRVGLRVNLNLMDISPDDCRLGEDYSRFGFSDKDGELGAAIERLRSMPGVSLCGLHLHRTSLTRSLEVYTHIAAYASGLVSKYGLDLSYIDIGGGFFGDMPGKPSFRDYADAIASGLSSRDITLIVEPGNALAASAFSFRTSIIDAKTVSGTRLLVCDGSRNDVDPFFRKKDYFKTFLFDVSARPVEPLQQVVGCTCLENDRLFTVMDSARMEPGDEIEFSSVGAYTMALSPLFIRYFPRVYMKSGDALTLYAEEWNEKDYLKKYGI